MKDIESLSREFCRLAGICWHEPIRIKTFPSRLICYKCGRKSHNPDLTDAKEVLKVMRKRGDWPDFCEQVGHYDGKRGFERIDVEWILDKTGLLLEDAVEFLRREK